MLLLLRKKLLIPLHSTHLLHFRSLSASVSATQNPQPKEPTFMESYHSKSRGFTPAMAATKITHIKSPQNPNSAITFLKHWGFDETHIRRLVTTHPPLLSCDVDQSLEPNIRTLLDIGFSRQDLLSVIIRWPSLLVIPSLVPRIDFWKTLLGNDLKKLRMFIEKRGSLVVNEPTDNITTKIGILKNHGLSDRQIQSLLPRGSKIFGRTTDSIQSLLKWSIDLGLQVHSSMFVSQLHVLAISKRECFHANMELFKKYGWSDQEFLSAFNKNPLFTHFTEMTIQARMEFLVERAGCVPSYIADHPTLITFSLEKRLVPRNHVLEVLKVKEVAVKDFRSTMFLTDDKFLETCVHQYEGKIPELRKIYEDACAGELWI